MCLSSVDCKNKFPLAFLSNHLFLEETCQQLLRLLKHLSKWSRIVLTSDGPNGNRSLTFMPVGYQMLLISTIIQFSSDL